MAADSTSGFVCTGLIHDDGTHDVFMHNGRRLPSATDCPQSIEERGFCLVRGVPTSIPMAAFSEHFVHKSIKGINQMFTFTGGNAVTRGARASTFTEQGFVPVELDESTELVARYQEETANAVKQAFPKAEFLLAYNQILRSSTAPASGATGQGSEAPSAQEIAQRIIGHYAMVKYFPVDSLNLIKKMLLEDDDVSAFLDMLISGQVKRNPYAQMSGASPELQAEVREILRSDPRHDFIARLKGVLQGDDDAFGDAASGARSADDGNVDPPALNNIHSDLTEDFGMAQLQKSQWQWLQGQHVFRARKYMVYHLNLWRNINPEEGIRNYHLAVLDKSSLSKGDVQKRELKFDSYPLEQYGLRHSPAQRWVYFPEMRMDEILMLQQGKCMMDLSLAQGPAKFSLIQEEHPQSVLHTAILDPSAPAEARRISCESRFLVFVPAQEPSRSAL